MKTRASSFAAPFQRAALFHRAALTVALIMLLVVGLLTPSARAQVAVTDVPPPAGTFEAQMGVVETLLRGLVGLVSDAALEPSPARAASDRLREMTDRLKALTTTEEDAAAGALGLDDRPARGGSGFRVVSDRDASTTAAELTELLVDMRLALRMFQEELEDAGETRLAERAGSLRSSMNHAISLSRDLESTANVLSADQPANRQVISDRRVTSDRDRPWLKPGDYETGRRDGDRAEDRRDEDEWTHEDEWDENRSDRDRWDDDDWDGDQWKGDQWKTKSRWDRKQRRDEDDWRRYRRRSSDFDRKPQFVGTLVGEWAYGWPLRETGVYRSAPAFRYNRVEGMVVGVRKLPLSWDSWRRSGIYGQAAYATGSDRGQFEVGGELRAGPRRRGSSVDAKVGAAYRRLTTTNDIWKSNWAENTIGALLFNYDFFDYYETEGWTAYAAVRATPYLQLTGGFRQEDHRALANEVTWSLFGGRHFRTNLPADEGEVQSVVLALEGGAVDDLESLPSGAAFRLEAEIADGFGGDFDFNRYTGDVRVYAPVSRNASLALRTRGTVANGDVPYQKLVTIGGLGSVRAYPQNAFIGSRMIIGNAELNWERDVIFDDVLLIGFFDAGWTNGFAGSNKFDFGDMIKTAGVGIGLGDRTLRLELAFPLDDIAGDRDPEFWIRINPTF